MSESENADIKTPPRRRSGGDDPGGGRHPRRSPGWFHYLKRWLYLTHRWIGIVTCLFFAMWFLSGLVLLYVPFPSLERDEWLAGQQPIDWSRVQAAPDRPGIADDGPGLRELVLEMRGDEPVWRWTAWSGEGGTHSAVDGKELGAIDPAQARDIAELFAKAPVTRLDSIGNDQWTVGGGYDRHRPLWKASITGAAGRVIYISSRDGSVMLETTAKERFWNWLGAVPHWIYPTILRQDAELWRQVVLWLSGPAIIGAITGIWIGILRVRLGRRRFRDRRITPYHGWMKWHHLTGLAGGLFLLLWIFSGWLSVDPGGLFGGQRPGPEMQRAYAGPIRADFDPRRLAMIAPEAQRITSTSAAGSPFLRIEQSGEPDRQLDAHSFAPENMAEASIRAAVPELYPGREIVKSEIVREPDAYWYAVNGEIPLPVLRLRLDDSAGTWLHVDPATGEVRGSLDRRGRLYRWLYNLFHRWDLGILLDNRPVRDLLIWVFSLLGLASSITGIRIGWTRLRPRKPQSRKGKRLSSEAGPGRR